MSTCFYKVFCGLPEPVHRGLILPEDFGYWHRVDMRYNRWCKKGTRNKILEAVAYDPDVEYLMVGGSIVRVHQHGAAIKQQRDEAMGKSLGGFSSKIHAALDSLGNPLGLILTAGTSFRLPGGEKFN